MKLFPQIFTAGIANSGTSFLTELVVRATGLSPGPADGLKPADHNNRYGFWEYLPLRRAFWMASGGNFDVQKIPVAPVRPNSAIGQPLADMARSHGVEVFKCVKLPWIYPWFEPRKAIVIFRSADTIYRNHPSAMTPNEYRGAHTRYYDMAAKYLEADWDILHVRYEDFLTDTEKQIERVCEYLGCPYHKWLLHTFRPRE